MRMAGVVENLNVRVALKLEKKTATKVARRQTILRLNDVTVAIFHSAVGTLF